MSDFQNLDYNYFPHHPSPPKVPLPPPSPPGHRPPLSPQTPPAKPPRSPPHYPLTPPTPSAKPPPSPPHYPLTPPTPPAKPPTHPNYPPPSPTVKPPPPGHPVTPLSPPNHPPTSPSPAAKPPIHPISPPFHPISPPPPHVVPTPPPSPPGGHSSHVIIIVFVSLGGLFFLTFLSVALFCFLMKGKKKLVQETDITKFNDHVRVQEEIVPGPHGTQTVIVTMDEDMHAEEKIKKHEEVLSEDSYIKSIADHHHNKHHPQPLVVAESATESDNIQHDRKTMQ